MIFLCATYTGLVEVGVAVVVVCLIVVVVVLVVCVGTRVTGFIQLERLHPRILQVHLHKLFMLGLLVQKAPHLRHAAIS